MHLVFHTSHKPQRPNFLENSPTNWDRNLNLQPGNRSPSQQSKENLETGKDKICQVLEMPNMVTNFIYLFIFFRPCLSGN